MLRESLRLVDKRRERGSGKVPPPLMFTDFTKTHCIDEAEIISQA